MRGDVVSGISPGFPELSQSQGQVAHVLLTRSPLTTQQAEQSVRLACVKHAASVRPEPGSNSPTRTIPANRPEHRHYPVVRTIHQPHNTTPHKRMQTLHGTDQCTLLSSQRTDTHRRQPLDRTSVAQFRPRRSASGNWLGPDLSVVPGGPTTSRCSFLPAGRTS